MDDDNDDETFTKIDHNNIMIFFTRNTQKFSHDGEIYLKIR